jgi:hypothetical protein
VQITEQIAAFENCCGHFCGRFCGNVSLLMVTERNDAYDSIVAERSMRDCIMAFGALPSETRIGNAIDRVLLLRRIARTRVRFGCDVALTLPRSSLLARRTGAVRVCLSTMTKRSE